LILSTSAYPGGIVIDDGYENSGEWVVGGIFRGLSDELITTGTKTIDYVDGSATFVTPLTNLTPATEYFYMAYVKNEVGTACC